MEEKKERKDVTIKLEKPMEVKVKGGKYIHLCKLNGKWTSGEVRTKKEVN
jgi:hypothetical protein